MPAFHILLSRAIFRHGEVRGDMRVLRGLRSQGSTYVEREAIDLEATWAGLVMG